MTIDLDVMESLLRANEAAVPECVARDYRALIARVRELEAAKGRLMDDICMRDEVVQMAEGRESLAMRREFASEAALKRVRALPGKWRHRETFLGENETERGFVMGCFECANGLEAALSGKDSK